MWPLCDVIVVSMGFCGQTNRTAIQTTTMVCNMIARVKAILYYWDRHCVLNLYHLPKKVTLELGVEPTMLLLIYIRILSPRKEFMHFYVRTDYA